MLPPGRYPKDEPAGAVLSPRGGRYRNKMRDDLKYWEGEILSMGQLTARKFVLVRDEIVQGGAGAALR